MTMNHLEQQVAGLKESLLNAGIGAAYHRKTLQEVAPDLFESVRDRIIPDAVEGKGILFVGGSQAYDEMMVTARALQLSRVSTYVVQLTRFVKWLDVDATALEHVNDAQALFIPRFVGDSPESPLTSWQTRLVEDFLVERIDSGQAFFAQVSGWNGSRWWSETFMKRLNSATTVRTCHESGTAITPRPY